MKYKTFIRNKKIKSVKKEIKKIFKKIIKNYQRVEKEKLLFKKRR